MEQEGHIGLWMKNNNSKAKFHMTEETSIKHTEKVKAAFTDHDWYLSGYEANIRIRSEVVARFAKGESPKTVADLGCGDGSLSISFLEQGAAVTFLDISAAMLKIVSTKLSLDLRQRATFINSDFFNANLPQESFDLAIFVGVLAYIDNLDEAAAQLRRIVRPGGKLILEYTDASHVMARLNFAYRTLASRFRTPKCHTFRHKRRDINSAFMNAGFIPLQSYRYIYTLPVVLRSISQERRYHWIRAVFGSVDEPHRQWFGSEDLTIYQA